MDAPTDKDLPLKEDTRLLGRLLGDVLRAQTGEEGFARIESIRQTAIRLRRASQNDTAGIKDELATLLNDLPIAQTLDAAANLQAQDRMRTLAARTGLVIPGHDPAVFTRFRAVADGVVQIAPDRAGSAR